MFIRRRESSDGSYSHQVIEKYRENGRVKQRVLANLGPYPTIEEAREQMEPNIELWEQELRLREKGYLPVCKHNRTDVWYDVVCKPHERYKNWCFMGKIWSQNTLRKDSPKREKQLKAYIQNYRRLVEVAKRYKKQQERNKRLG